MSKNTIKTPKLKSRKTWAINPVTRIKPSKKVYNRKKLKSTKVEMD